VIILNYKLTASHGQRRRSAMTSALAEERAQPIPLYLAAFSCPIQL